MLRDVKILILRDVKSLRNVKRFLKRKQNPMLRSAGLPGNDRPKMKLAELSGGSISGLCFHQNYREPLGKSDSSSFSLSTHPHSPTSGLQRWWTSETNETLACYCPTHVSHKPLCLRRQQALAHATGAKLAPLENQHNGGQITVYTMVVIHASESLVRS